MGAFDDARDRRLIERYDRLFGFEGRFAPRMIEMGATEGYAYLAGLLGSLLKDCLDRLEEIERARPTGAEDTD